MSDLQQALIHQHPDARGLVVSLRHLEQTPARASNVELEEVLAQIDQVDVLALPEHLGPPEPVTRALSKARRVLHLPGLPLPALELPRDYDFLFVALERPRDLYLLGPLQRWRRRCRLLVCTIYDLWADSLPQRAGELELLAQFDLVGLGFQGTVEPLARAIPADVRHVPFAVDALRFCPHPADLARVIDVYAMGRRSPTLHEELRALCRERGWFYLFNTMGAGQVPDPLEHRELLAELIGRSRYFLVDRAKALGEGSGPQEELAFRYFEGAAAGAVLVGETPAGPTFQEAFPWEDAVLPLPKDHAQVAALFDALEHDPQRVARIRRTNVSQSLQRHDWVYRWAELLETLGLPPAAGAAQRRARLGALAAEVEAT